MEKNLSKLGISGFSLIEVMISLLIVVVIMAGLFSSFRGQQRSHMAQSQTIEMQQNIRGVLYVMAREIRMAGYDPDNRLDAKILNAGDGSNFDNAFTFSFVINDSDTDVGELQTISYYLYDAYSDGDGNDGIGRSANGNLQPLADNIQTLEFTYLDQDGVETSDLSRIRSVQVNIIARVDTALTDYTINEDTRVTRSVSTIVNCRNLGF